MNLENHRMYMLLPVVTLQRGVALDAVKAVLVCSAGKAIYWHADAFYRWASRSRKKDLLWLSKYLLCYAKHSESFQDLWHYVLAMAVLTVAWDHLGCEDDLAFPAK